LLTAAGVSDKATHYLETDDRREILHEYVKNVLEPVGGKFVEELVYRFLLTRGDTLGGKVRNLVGVWAQRQFTNYIVSEFRVAGRELRWLDARRTRWQPVDELVDPDQVRAFAWTTGYLPRVLAYNVGVSLIKTDEEMAGESNAARDARSRGGKNVDLCLLQIAADAYIAKPTRSRAVTDR
jgi:hypothetical protein